MSSHWVFNGCDDALKKRMEEYWAKKWCRLERLLANYPPDLQDVHLTVYRHQKNGGSPWYELRAVIDLPTGVLAANASENDPLVILDRVADTLATEIKRHKELVRKDYLYKRKFRLRTALSDAGRPLEQNATGGLQEQFLRMLRPQLGFLRDHARRELRILELNGILHRGEVTVTDLLDEVTIRAWQKWSDRPRRLPLDLWLIDLLHQTLEEWIKQEPREHSSLLDEIPKDLPPDEAPQVDDQEWWAWLLGYDDSEKLEDETPGSELPRPFDRAELENQAERVLTLIRKLPTAQRQAFLLNALEDYDPEEIALLQNRPVDQVRSDIEAARETLKAQLQRQEHEQHEAAQK